MNFIENILKFNDAFKAFLLTGLHGTVATLLANGLEGTGFTSQYWLPTQMSF